MSNQYSIFIGFYVGVDIQANTNDQREGISEYIFYIYYIGPKFQLYRGNIAGVMGV